MLRDIVGSIESREMDGRRLKQAIDILLDYRLQFDEYAINHSKGLFAYRQRERRKTGSLK